jgi:hypothetical protein
MRVMQSKAAALARASQLLALWGFAVAQPIFDLLGRNAEFFVARRSTVAEVVAFALVLAVGAPLLVACSVEAVGGLFPRARRVLHLALIATLVASTVLPLLARAASAPAVVLAAIAAMAGFSAALAVARVAAAGAVVTLLGAAPVIFVAVFLGLSPVSRLLAPRPKAAPIARAIRDDAPPVVVVVFDELPLISLLDDRLAIDAGRYPRFGELARRTTWFRNATTVADSTTTAVPAILTGRYPVERRLPILFHYPENLFTLVPARMAVRASQPLTRLCPDTVCSDLMEFDGSVPQRVATLASDVGVIWLHLVLPREWTRRLPAVDQNWGGFGRGAREMGGVRGVTGPAARRAARDQTAVVRPGEPATAKLARREARKASREERRRFRAERLSLKRLQLGDPGRDRKAQFRRFLAGLPEGPAPSLSFLHVLLPHPPFVYLPSGREYDGGRDDPVIHQHVWGSDRSLPLIEYQRHLLQLGFVDHLVGELIDRLEEAGLWDRSLLVITADHGASFRPGERRRAVTATNRDEVMRVPLFLKLPHQQRGAVDDGNVETIDVLPTIAAALGIDLPWRVDGRSLLGTLGPERPEKRIFGNYQNLSAETLTFPPTFAIGREPLDWKLAWFGVGDPEALYGLGPAGVGVGRTRTEALGDGWSRAAVVLDRSDWTFPDRRAAQQAPSVVRGRLENGGGKGSAYLAIAVNGVIRSVTQTYADASGPEAFSAVLPTGSFREGANEVEAWTRSEEGAGRRP